MALDRFCFALDCLLALIRSLIRPRSSSRLICIFFHGVWDPARGGDPQERVTLKALEGLVDQFCKRGYKFVTASDLPEIKDAQGSFVMLTSDDGYASLLEAIPVLRVAGAGVTLFVVTGNAESGEAYWWDQLHEMGEAGVRDLPSKAELKDRPRCCRDRDAILVRHGMQVRKAIRPGEQVLNPQQLAEFVDIPGVSLGLHGHNHLAMDRLEDEVFRFELEACQARLGAWTGKHADFFAFPYGSHGPSCRQRLGALGIRWAFTTRPGRLDLPLESADPGPLFLPRYQFRGDRSPWWQVLVMHHGITAGFRFREWLIFQARRPRALGGGGG